MSSDYEDPLPRNVGIPVLIVTGLVLGAMVVSWWINWQIDRQQDYCEATKSYVPVAECREAAR